MRLSYIGTRAASDTADKARYAEIRWKDGYMKDEELGYIFRCLLEDNGYTYKTHADGKTCSVTVEVKNYDEFLLIKGLFNEAKDAFKKQEVGLKVPNGR